MTGKEVRDLVLVMAPAIVAMGVSSGLERGSKLGHRGDHQDRDAGRDEGVLDDVLAGLFVRQTAKQLGHVSAPCGAETPDDNGGGRPARPVTGPQRPPRERRARTFSGYAS